MKLADVRRLTIRKQSRIRFRLANGMECVVTEHGVAQVPGLNDIPDFNLENELASASEFVLEPVEPAESKAKPKPRTLSRDELAGMVTAPAGGHAEPEEE
jgi:hypothetical protein